MKNVPRQYLFIQSCILKPYPQINGMYSKGTVSKFITFENITPKIGYDAPEIADMKIATAIKNFGSLYQ